MSNQNAEEVVVQLEKANQSHNDVWRLWRYTKRDRILVLCGYNQPFTVTSFLIFKGTSFIRLYQWLHNATFQLDHVLESDHNQLTRKAIYASEHVITIKAEAGSYCIVCREVEFLALPEGAAL